MDYEVVIGLEVHSELKTESKIFCGCKNVFGGEPNSHCCPICSGHPGVLPVLNRQAVEYTVLAGLALNCRIPNYSKFDRKNYYYPDLPKAWQTSQYDYPFCKDGWLEVDADGQVNRVRINRIHLEEDAGKLIHSEWGSGTLVDYNRCGVPLIEIVTEPDLRSPEEALQFLEKLKSILKYTGVSDCKMEQGSLRCDINVSLRPKGQAEYGTRTEMKNVNSFSAAYRAMKYEVARQLEVLSSGGEIHQETRRWDDTAGRSTVMRTKEDAQDYRYFPEPDLVPVVLEDSYIEGLRAKLPLLPADRKASYMEKYGLSDYDADILTADKEIADFFDECLKYYDQPKTTANWIMGDLMRKLKDTKSEDIEIGITAQNFAEVLRMYEASEVSQSGARTLLELLWGSDRTAAEVVEAEGLKQNNDADELLALVKKIIAENPQPVKDYQSGNKKALAFFVGQIMKATKGKANHRIINELLIRELGE